MNENDERFLWQMIEVAWAKAESADPASAGDPTARALRERILAGEAGDTEVAMRPLCWALEDILTDTVTRDGLLSFAEAFERKLFALDREDLAARVALGDDGFLDARGFIIAMGEDYCAGVLARSEAALLGASAEQAYMSVIRAYEARFHEPFPRFGIRVTTCSNLEGWPSRRKVVALATRVEQVRRDLLALIAAHRAPPSGGPLVVSLDAEQRAYLEGLLASRAPAPREGR